MNQDLKMIKKLYGENMAHLCRMLFPTILEVPGLLVELMTQTFEPSHLIYNDVYRNRESFQEYIIKLATNKKGKYIRTGKSVRELMDEAGYDFFECKTEEQIQSFRKYYRKGEEICTFWTNRLKSCYVFFAVKKNVGEIKRENFPKPMRQDEYGTSVISIQFSKGNNTLSIKNRYNHTVHDPDATFSNNLENIIWGLTDAFEREYGFRLRRKKVGNLELRGYANVDGKFYKYNYEIDNIYYCTDNVVIDNFEVKKYEKEKYIVMDYFVLDLVNKKLSINPNSPSTSKDSFIDEFNDIKKISVINTKGGNKELRIITKTNHEIIIGLDNCNRIISYHNPRVVEIKDNFLKYNKTLKDISLPNLKKVGNDFLCESIALEKLSLPSLEETGDYFLFNSYNLKSLDAPILRKTGDGFLSGDLVGGAASAAPNISALSLPSLEEVGNWSLCNTYIEELELPKLKKVGKMFCINNQRLKSLSLPSLEETGNYFLKAVRIEELKLPKLKKIGKYFLSGDNENLKSLSFPTLEETGDDFLSDNKCLEKIELPKLKKVGNNFLFNNRKLKAISLPSLEEVGNSFIEKNRFLKEVYFPKLRNVGTNFLKHNTSLRKLYLPLLEIAKNSFLENNKFLQEFSTPNLKKVGNNFLKNVKDLKLLFIPSLEESTKEELFKRLCIEGTSEKNEPNLSASEEIHEVPIVKVELSSKHLGHAINETIKNGAEIAASQSMEPLELEGVTRR